MEERFRESYFVLLRIALLLILEIYIALSQTVLTGASVKVLLILALLIGLIAGKELVGRRIQILFLGAAGALVIFIIVTLGTAFTLLGIFLCYEMLTYFKPRLLWYFIPLGLAFIPATIETPIQLLITIFMGMIYCQHDFVVESYRT
ncbi:MAG: hypothetical protein K2M22_12520, partial [Lachnospiraceae bacterium]|nr:hypothetical protein [Lachnospiraceae bacterium]